MTKKIMFLFVLCCSLQSWASVQTQTPDTVYKCRTAMATEMLQPLQPTYEKGAVIASPWSGHWFVGAQGGASAFLGKPLGCDDLFGRTRGSYAVHIGKWFTPSIGVRAAWQGGRFKDGELQSHNYRFYHADLLWNVTSRLQENGETQRWSVVPFVGVGLLHNKSNGQKPFAFTCGVQGAYKLSQRLSLTMELSNATTFQEFDGVGRTGKLGDNLLTLSAGLAVNIGKTTWKRPIDAKPYIRQNEWLTDYANALASDNARYASQHDRDSRTLAELRKILAIEGLLDKYAGLFDSDDNVGKGYPRNDYNGLNSLRARLRNRHWDGKSPLATSIAQPRDTTSVSNDNGYLNLLQNGDECLGAPIYFFFELGTTRLTDTSQGVNLDELARVAKKYGLAVTITGAADSATGTPSINDRLSQSRADYIAKELSKRGVPDTGITKTAKGGISDYRPNEANRHTRVALYIK